MNVKGEGEVKTDRIRPIPGIVYRVVIPHIGVIVAQYVKLHDMNGGYMWEFRGTYPGAWTDDQRRWLWQYDGRGLLVAIG